VETFDKYMQAQYRKGQAAEPAKSEIVDQGRCLSEKRPKCGRQKGPLSNVG
jgi:hypothetical protein